MNARHEANKLVASGNSDSVKQSNEALSEEDKKKLKQRPVATEAVPGTPWLVTIIIYSFFRYFPIQFLIYSAFLNL